MKAELIKQYEAVLLSELKPALGCTEPIAIAFAAARAWEEIGGSTSDIKKVEIYCSGNIIKNVKGVTVPNTGGLKGIDIAAACGIAGGNAERCLEVLCDISQEEITLAQKLCETGIFGIHLVQGEENLYVKVEIITDTDTASAEIIYDHTRINKVIKNGTVIENEDVQYSTSSHGLPASCTVKEILDFAKVVNFSECPALVEALQIQIKHNVEIAQRGIAESFGAEVGKTILEMAESKNPEIKAKALAAAGSDARMGGCNSPVVINSGSGNQGMTVSIPVFVFAEELQVSEDTLLRALVISNLIAIHQKRYIGKLSAYCGVVSASAAAGAGISFLKGHGYDLISRMISNTLGTIGGIVCDGAKASCASKIAQSIDCMFLGMKMAESGRTFVSGDGLIGEDVEETIRNFGRMAKEGMKSTDIEILNIMTEL